ncbi:MAG: hypothetical protein AB7G48_10950 [Nitrospiraceae bacterium]
MATVLGQVTKLINQTSTQILDNQIPKQFADLITSFVNGGFQIVEDALKITKELTKESSPSNQGDT